MIRLPPRATRLDTRFPYTTRFRTTSERRWSNVSLSHAVCGRFEHDRPRGGQARLSCPRQVRQWKGRPARGGPLSLRQSVGIALNAAHRQLAVRKRRSEEQTSELQSLMRSSYAVFCLKKKKQSKN